MAQRLLSLPDQNGAIIRVVHGAKSVSHGLVEFASVLPQSSSHEKPKLYHRWIVLGSRFGSDEARKALERSTEIMTNLGESCSFLQSDTLVEDFDFDHEKRTPLIDSNLCWSQTPVPDYSEYRCDQRPWIMAYFSARRKFDVWRNNHFGREYSEIDYYLHFGNTVAAGIFVPYIRSVAPRPQLPIDFLTTMITSGQLSIEKYLLMYKGFLDPSVRPKFFKSLDALARAYEIYQSIPQADIDLSVASKPLYTAKWASVDRLSRSVSLACVSMFDTGSLDIQTETFGDVIAISSANNIYAIETLFSDPYSSAPDHRLRHVIGNLGKPGLSLLVCPKDTILRDPDLETWKLINHVEFDGKFEDHFASTSLHLSLTGYERALNVSEHGGRDNEASYVEAALSAHDRGTWVADINVLRCEPHDRLPECLHTEDEKISAPESAYLTSIDNWYEYLDPPPNAGIIRARGNWIARLALAAVQSPRNMSLSIGCNRMCRVCVQGAINSWKDPDKGLLLC